VTSTQGLVRDKQYTYDNSVIQNIATYVGNSTNYEYILQTYVFDNNTYLISIPSLTFSTTIVNPSKFAVFFNLNFTSIIDTNVYKIELYWNYIGTGNITLAYVTIKDTPFMSTGAFGTGNYYGLLQISNPVEANGTYIYKLETFESMKLKTFTYWRIGFEFTDSSNFPSSGNYIEVEIHIYKKDTILTKEQLINSVLAILTVINIVIALFMTSLLDVKDLKKLFK